MAIKTHSCFSVECDACGESYSGSYENGTQHYDSQEEALGDAEGSDWCTTTSGGAVCDGTDDAHVKAVATHHGVDMEADHNCWRLTVAEATP